MKNYKPMVHDVISRDGMSLTIDRVFPAQVIFTLGGVQYDNPIDQFSKKAQVSFSKGATLTRGGEVIWPEPTKEVSQVTTPPPTEEPSQMTEETSQGQSGSHNTHARLSPSDSKRWSNCSASIAFEEANAHRVKKDDGSVYSNEGTEAHDWAADVLLGKIGFDDIPEKFRDPVRIYVEECRSLVEGAELQKLGSVLEDADLGFPVSELAFFVEEEVPLFYQKEQHGTADFLAIRSEGINVTHFYARDYKHGAGVLVDTEENTQLAIYVYSAITALQGAYEFPDDAEINMSVTQPRHREAETQKPWIMKLADLRTFCEDIEVSAEKARSVANTVREKIGAPGHDVSCDDLMEVAPDAVFAPKRGDNGACRWCKCAAFCTKLQDSDLEGLELPSMPAHEMLAAMPELDKEEAKEPTEARIALRSEALDSKGRLITDEYLVQVVGNKKAIVAFLNDAEEYLEGRLLDGEEIPGVKLVEGRMGNRTWANEEEAETFLKGQKLKQGDRFDMKLKSPSKIEAILKDKLKNTRTKNRFEALVTRSAGKKKLAIDADDREAVPSAVAAMPDMGAVDDFEV